MGCGGYGLPLAAYIRGNLSRSAIYVAAAPLMFGIWGSRWVGRPDVKAIANEFWVRQVGCRRTRRSWRAAYF